MKVLVTQLCPTLFNPMDYSPWNSPGQNTGVGPRRRKRSGALEIEIGGLELSRRRKGRTVFFPLHSLVSVNYTTQFKLRTKDYTTTMYPAGKQFLLPENLLTNPDILQ